MKIVANFKGKKIIIIIKRREEKGKKRILTYSKIFSIYFELFIKGLFLKGLALGLIWIWHT